MARRRNPDIGAVRDFFLNMLRTAHTVTVPAKGDFLVDDAITFEVGGKNKDAEQIKGMQNAWLALDNIAWAWLPDSALAVRFCVLSWATGEIFG